MAGKTGWPSGIPLEVPPFSYGSIGSVTRTVGPDGLSWSMTAGEVTPDAVRYYEKELKAHGFRTSSMIVNSGGSMTGENGDISVAVVMGSGNATISVALQK